MDRLYVLLCLLVFCFSVDAYNCSWTNDARGLSYDLSALQSTSDYVFFDDVTQAKYYLDVCQAAVYPLCGLNSACCQLWDDTWDRGFASLGTVGTAAFSSLENHPYKDGLTLSFTGGDPVVVNGTGYARSMQIDFVCDWDGGAGSPVLASAGPPAAPHYVFQWLTHYACSGPPAPPPPPSACTPLADCKQCVDSTSAQCSWCLDSDECMLSSQLNTTACPDYVRPGAQCPLVGCAIYQNCTACVPNPGCSWCIDDGLCIPTPTNVDTCHNAVKDPAYCSY